MRFSEFFTASILATITAAHGSGIPGAPKIVGTGASDIAALRARNILGSRRVAHQPHNAKLEARQGGDVNGRCGKDFGCATCAAGYCCSSGGYCGQGSDYCQAPDSQFEYGPAADANTVPPGGSTLNTARTKVGSVLYGGEGIYVCTKPGQIAITYDDGPYSYTGKVLDLFASYGFKATFFITGINLSKGRIDDAAQPWTAIITRMLSEGHQLASHTWSHQDLSAITKAQRYDQMVRLEMAMTNIIGKFPTYMRPPYSSCSAASGCETDMADLGYHVSYFDLDTDDYNNITPELQQNAKNNFYNAVNPSNAATDEFLGIAHDIHYQTAYNLTGYILDLMVKKGYTGVTMGECLGDPEANWYRTPAARVASTSSFSAPACASTVSSATRSASSTSSGVFATPTAVSQDSSCGAAVGLTCLGFSGGECCSQYNFCGNTAGHCGTGCQAGYGKCGDLSSSSSSSASGSASSSQAASSSAGSSSASRASSSLISSTRVSSSAAASATVSRTPSTDATCAGVNGYTCVGSTFGDCCSQYGWCGSTTAHCGTGCNPLYGKCPDTSSSSSIASSSAVSSSAAASSSSIASSSVVSSSVSRSSSAVSSVVSSVSSSAARSSSSVASSSSASSLSVRSSSSSVAPSSSSVRSSSSSVPSSSSSVRPSSSSVAPSSSSAARSSSSSVAQTSSSRPASSSSSSVPVTSSSSSRAASSSSSRPASSSSTRAASSSVSSSRAASSSVSSSRAASSSPSSSRPASTSTRASSSSLIPTSTRSSSASPSSTLKVSTDASCGGNKGYTCLGSTFGDCCSQYGWCGSTTAYCGTGCLKNFGKCT